MLSMFDYWFVVDGAAGTKGSTAWCKDIHKGCRSQDGTIEYLKSLKADNLWLIEANKKWISKDEMVNTAISNIKMIADKCWLYQVDCDEQWKVEQLTQIEKEMKEQNAKTGNAHFNHYVGKTLIAVGEWGGGTYTRIWDWKGELFQSHEPPLLRGGNGKEVTVTPRFNHYSYYFEQDIMFKEKYYGYTGLTARWKKVNSPQAIIPCPLKSLIPNQHFSNSNSQIVRI